MILIFTATSVGFMTSPGEEPVPVQWIALANGLVVCVLIESMGHICGAVLNPVVSIMFIITRQISPLKACVYIGAQCAGGSLGSAIAYGVANPVARANLVPIGLNDISVYAGVGCEAFITHTLCLAILGTGDQDKRAVYMPGVPIGFSVFVGIATAGRLTGGAMNPLISFGPATVTGNFTDHWIYWVGPMAGMILATLEYNLLFSSFWPKAQEQSLNTKDVPLQESNGHARHAGPAGHAAYDNVGYSNQDSSDPQTRF